MGRGTTAVRDERGQILPLFAALLATVLFGIAALVLDYGHALVVHRQLQSTADAAALAGAQALPDTQAAAANVTAYGSGPGAANTPAGAIPGSATESESTLCSTGGATCTSPDTVVVHESADVAATFAKALGVGSFHVAASSAACNLCQAVPMDVVVLLDRTYSMCEDSSGNVQPGCPDLTNARKGIQTLLGYLDPTIDRVALALTPPSISHGNACESTSWLNSVFGTGGYPASTDTNYVVVPLTSDFAGASSTFQTALNCVQGGGSTSIALALEQANAELYGPDARSVDQYGQPVQKVLIFLSDGAANSAPLSKYPSGSGSGTWGDWWTRWTWGSQPAWSNYIIEPCGQAVSSAGTIKAQGTTVFTIGYDIQPNGAQSSDPYVVDTNQCFEAPHGSIGYLQRLDPSGLTAYQTLLQIATKTSDFYDQTTPGSLVDIFTNIARTLDKAKLVPMPAGG